LIRLTSISTAKRVSFPFNKDKRVERNRRERSGTKRFSRCNWRSRRSARRKGGRRKRVRLRKKKLATLKVEQFFRVISVKAKERQRRFCSCEF